MKTIIQYQLSAADQPVTAEQLLKREGYSSSLIRRLKNMDNGLSIDGRPAYTIHLVKPGQTLEVRLPKEAPSEHIVQTPMDLNICYEDDDIMVINKPAGVPIHPSQGSYSNTLANGVAWYLNQKGEPCTFRAINRLDRDTTGLLILARHSLSACVLSGMVRQHLICRYYVAAACGFVPESGVIDAPIARLDGSTIERCVNFGKGEAAVTFYRRIAYNRSEDISLVALRLKTGRTHQIRVHMKFIGHPLPGDFLYHPDYRLIGRQALHSYRLSFLHPLSHQPLAFQADLPDDMKFCGITSIEDLWDNDF